jgi:hypothetical protein
MRQKNMATEQNEVTVQEARGWNLFNRASWGAIFVGVVIALAVNLTLQMLGLALGSLAINPTTEVNPFEGLASGAAIWIAASMLIALFSGGYAAGRLAGYQQDATGILHGLAVWGVMTLVTWLMLSTFAGSIMNGVANVVGGGLSLAGQAVQEVAPEVQQAIDMRTTTLDNILLDSDELQPDATAIDRAEVRAAVLRILQGGDTLDETTRQEAVTTIADRTALTEAEIEQRINRYQTLYQQTVNDVEQRIEETSGNIADTVAAAAGAAFLALISGAFAAGAGGLVGSPSERVVAERRRVISHTYAEAT